MRDRLQHELFWGIVCLSAVLIAILTWFGGALVHDYIGPGAIPIACWAASGLSLIVALTALIVGTEYN